MPFIVTIGNATTTTTATTAITTTTTTTTRILPFRLKEREVCEYPVYNGGYYHVSPIAALL